MAYDPAHDRFTVRYRETDGGPPPLGRQVERVVVLRRGRRLLEELGHRLGRR